MCVKNTQHTHTEADSKRGERTVIIHHSERKILMIFYDARRDLTLFPSFTFILNGVYENTNKCSRRRRRHRVFAIFNVFQTRNTRFKCSVPFGCAMQMLIGNCANTRLSLCIFVTHLRVMFETHAKNWLPNNEDFLRSPDVTEEKENVTPFTFPPSELVVQKRFLCERKCAKKQ